jgi:hypothetical protein
MQKVNVTGCKRTWQCEHSVFNFHVWTYRCNANSVAQEPEGSSPHSQNPATGPMLRVVFRYKY